MPYLKIVKRPHECVKPTSILGRRGSRGIYIGTIWQCPDCEKQWIVDSKNSVLYWREALDDEKVASNDSK